MGWGNKESSLLIMLRWSNYILYEKPKVIFACFVLFCYDFAFVVSPLIF